MAETTLTRRSFVKASALVGATAAFGFDAAVCRRLRRSRLRPAAARRGSREDEDVLPRLHPDVPGYRVSEGRRRRKAGRRPRRAGKSRKLCIKGLNSCTHVQPPPRAASVRRAGERGENKWEVISWDEAVEEAATHICDAIDKYGPYSFFASVGGGGAYSFMEAMTLPMAFGRPPCSSPAAPVLSAAWSMSKLFYGGNDQSIRRQRRAGDIPSRPRQQGRVWCCGAPSLPSARRRNRVAEWPSCAPRA